MAIKGVKGQQGTVYVIKGDDKAQNMAQFWSNLVSQEKYKLVDNAIKIAMAEEKGRATDRLAEAKLIQQQKQRLQSGIASLEKQKTALITKEAQMKQQLDVAKTPSTSTTSGSTGSAGKRDPNAQQALAETKEFRRLQASKDDLQRDKANFERNAALFDATNPNFAAAERDKAAAAQDRINQIDGVLFPGGVAADANGNGVIDKDETGSILPEGSFGVSDGKKGGARTTTTRKKITTEPADFSGRRAELEQMIQDLERQGQGLVASEVQRNPSILARAAEISGRTQLGSQRSPEMEVPQLAQQDIERRMMQKYFPKEAQANAALERDLEVSPMRKPEMKRPFSSTIDAMRPDFSQVQPPQQESALQLPDEPMESAFQMEDPTAPLNRSLEEDPLEAKPKTLKERAEELRQRLLDAPKIDVPQDIGSSPSQSVAGGGYFAGDVPDGVEVPPEAMLSGQPQGTPMDTNKSSMSGLTPLDDAIDTLQGIDIGMSPDFDKKGGNEMELYNQLIEGETKPPEKEEGAFNTEGDNKLKQSEALAQAVQGGRTKTKQEVRRQLESAENTEWASVVTKLYSPPPNASAQERIRLRDNAYQQLYKTYEDSPTVLADATEFLISLDALEMGALPS
jgi:hypothetical protein